MALPATSLTDAAPSTALLRSAAPDPLVVRAGEWIELRARVDALSMEADELQGLVFDKARELGMRTEKACRSSLPEARAWRAKKREFENGERSLERMARAIRNMRAVTVAGAIARIELSLASLHSLCLVRISCPTWRAQGDVRPAEAPDSTSSRRRISARAAAIGSVSVAGHCTSHRIDRHQHRPRRGLRRRSRHRGNAELCLRVRTSSDASGEHQAVVDREVLARLHRTGAEYAGERTRAALDQVVLRSEAIRLLPGGLRTARCRAL